MALLLILLFVVFFVVSFFYILKINYFWGIYYLFLFIYTIFNQLGYILVPDIVIAKGLYWNSNLFFEYWLFVTLSFIWLFGLLVVADKGLKRQKGYAVRINNSELRKPLFYLAVSLFLAFYTVNLVSYPDNFSYVSQASMPTFTYESILVSIMNLLFIILYIDFRSSRRKSVWGFLVLLVSMFLFLMTVVLGGDRSTLLATFIAIVFYEFAPFIRNWHPHKFRLAIAGLLLIMFFFFAQRISQLRGMDDYSLSMFFDFSIVSGKASQIVESIIFQDYFFPSTVLFSSIANHYINALEVFRSNFYNALILQNYPTLSQSAGTLTTMTTRNIGSAYYVLTEGYNVFGQLGFLYNGFVLTLGLVLWRAIAHSKNKELNRFLFSIMAFLVISMVRAQTSYFIKNIYVVILPALMLYYWAKGIRPAFFHHSRYYSRVIADHRFDKVD